MFIKSYESDKLKVIANHVYEKYKEKISHNEYQEVNLKGSVSEVNSKTIGAFNYLNEHLLAECELAINDYFDFSNLIGNDSFYFSHFSFMHQREGFNVPYHYDSEVLRGHDDSVELRNFAILLYLNDDFEGGQLHFPLQKEVVEPKQGKLLIFPTSFMYPHVTSPALGGDRYVLRVNYFFDLDCFGRSG